jgi:ABC-2 type transport system permease protein
VSALHIAAKDLRLILRDRVAVLFLLVVPIAVITIVASTLGGDDPGSILLPVVNEDQGPVATLLIEVLSDHAEVVEVDRAHAERLVEEEIRTGAALILPERLSKHYLADRPSTLLLLTDPAKRIQLATLKAYLLQADREAAALADPLSEELLVLEEQSLTSDRLSVSSSEQNVPGFSIMFVLMGVLFGLAFGLWDERETGALTRLRVAPISRPAILAGKLVARFAVGMVQIAILFAFGHWVFDVSLGASLPAFGITIAAIVFGMTGFSLLVAAFARTREQIIPLGLTVVMLVCAVGGCWWPLFMEPLWLQRIAHLTPTAWAMDALNDLILRDRGLVDVLPLVGALFVYGAVCMVLGARLYRFDPESD